MHIAGSFDIRLSMSLKNVLNIVLVTFWIVSQTVMSFAHSPSLGTARAGSETSDVAANLDHASHLLAATTMNQANEPAGDYDRDAGFQDCGSAECSIAGTVDLPDQSTGFISRIFNLEHKFTLSPVDPGLPTPPPNTIV